MFYHKGGKTCDGFVNFQYKGRWRDGFMEPLKVSSKSAPNAVAGAIAGVIRESGCAELQAVGAGAANHCPRISRPCRDRSRMYPGVRQCCNRWRRTHGYPLNCGAKMMKKGFPRGPTCQRYAAGLPCGNSFCGSRPPVRPSSLFYGNNID